MGLFRKGKTCIIAKFQRTGLVIPSHSIEGKNPSYSQTNTVVLTGVHCLMRLTESMMGLRLRQGNLRLVFR